jgi:hypothetical protein
MFDNPKAAQNRAGYRVRMSKLSNSKDKTKQNITPTQKEKAKQSVKNTDAIENLGVSFKNLRLENAGNQTPDDPENPQQKDVIQQYSSRYNPAEALRPEALQVQKNSSSIFHKNAQSPGNEYSKRRMILKV